MPELPEVETVRRGLQPAMEGGPVVGATLPPLLRN
jgi:formamidopyrimidine-DNA glycosylase